ncbi:HAMP domain-containing histidine kinase [Vibrio sp. SCSIO 43135]|uniref:sensor histidine kinase n=1 Tax=Vibrio sp. SCSIO 43135 TaxID=2819096 RepID=UPI002075818A|nr:HAMP domain-containing sensor histidine kinase [Vibrio sp. SCSIO 43135]USD42169.1 HAMP domain-containing histidine kinase [Vibrio sp. SCSIO 43135]
MITHFLNSTKSLTGRLATFFTFVSVVIGLVTFLMFIAALQWSEDRVGERRILIDRDEAAQRFIQGESGVIQIDALTYAYNDLSLLPKPYDEFIKGKQNFLGEVGHDFDPLSHMVYVGHYWVKGEQMPLVLLSQIDRVEFGVDELVYSGTIVIGLVAALMFMFGTLLYRLSQRLIEPVNDIANQLEQLSGDAQQPFKIRPGAAVEFQVLTERLNTYRSDIHALLKREQAFARYASHELRTPITIVKGANKLLSKAQPTDFQHRQIERIDEASQQMSTMVDALLSLVRYERDASSCESRVFGKTELEQIVAQNSAQAITKNVELVVSVTSEPVIDASPAIVNMVLGNLLRNAIAATNQGKVTVSLSEHCLVVEDEGEGLAEKPNQEGHGLGLLIVDDLCQRYHWQFSLTNRQGKGCRADIQFTR